MLIFSRRTLQKLIKIAASHVPISQLKRLASNVDLPKKNGIPDVWEIYLFVGHLLAHEARYEVLLPSGKKPDFFLPRHLVYVDVKTISDDHAHRLYPIGYFMDSFKDQIRRQLPVLGDFNVEFGWRQVNIDGQHVHVPVLPPKGDISKVTKDIAKALRQLGGDFTSPFSHSVKFEDTVTKISFKPSSRQGFPLVGWGAPSFTTHRKHDREVDSVAKRALDEASAQLASTPDGSIKGVYLCDGGSDLWTKGSHYRTFPIHDIAKRFLSKSTKLDFIVLFTVQKNNTPPARASSSQLVLLPSSMLAGEKARYKISYSVIAKSASIHDQIENLVGEALSLLDAPLQNIETAYANRMRTGSSLGFRGAMTTNGNDKIRIPARSLAEILAGGSVAEILDGKDSPSRASNLFAKFHGEGRTITQIEFVSGQPEDDDWVDLTFGPTDPAVSPLEVP